jgi:hypothetical protein
MKRHTLSLLILLLATLLFPWNFGTQVKPIYYSLLQLTTARQVKVRVKVTLRLTVSQSVGLRVEPPDIDYCLTVRVLFLWGDLSDERMGLSFVYAVGPCQRSLSWVQVPWDSQQYFTVSDLRLPFSSPPTTRRFTVEVFDPASTRVKPANDFWCPPHKPSTLTYRKHITWSLSTVV